MLDSRASPRSFRMTENNVALSWQSVSPPVRPALIPRRSSRAASDTKEERDYIKPARTSHSKEPTGKTVVVQDEDSLVDVQFSSAECSAQPMSESEADATGECPKKLVWSFVLKMAFWWRRVMGDSDQEFKFEEFDPSDLCEVKDGESYLDTRFWQSQMFWCFTCDFG